MIKAIGAALSAVLASPAFAAGDSFPAGGPWWVAVVFYGPLIAILSLLAVGSGFFLGGFFRFSMTVLVILVAAFVLPIYVFLTRDLNRAIDVSFAETLMILLISPAIAVGWWLGRKDEARRSSRRATLSAGKNHD